MSSCRDDCRDYYGCVVRLNNGKRNSSLFILIKIILASLGWYLFI